MNKTILTGRLTRDPEIRYMQNESATAIARYSLAVPRKIKTDGNDCDFINCVAFGKSAEFAEKYLHKGIKIAVTGRLQTGSYTDKDGRKVYTTDVIVEEQEFCESKNANGQNDGRKESQKPVQSSIDDFMSIPTDIDDSELPFA